MYERLLQRRKSIEILVLSIKEVSKGRKAKRKILKKQKGEEIIVLRMKQHEEAGKNYSIPVLRMKEYLRDGKAYRNTCVEDEIILKRRKSIYKYLC
jgi:hypothetical protein